MASEDFANSFFYQKIKIEQQYKNCPKFYNFESKGILLIYH
jgi:hypothetical protein